MLLEPHTKLCYYVKKVVEINCGKLWFLSLNEK